MIITSFIIHYFGWQARSRFGGHCPRWGRFAQADCRHEIRPMTFLDPGAFIRTNPEIKNATASLIVTTKTNEKNRVPELVLELCRPVRQQADGARFRAVGRDYHEALSVRRHIVAGIGEVGQVQLEKRCHGIDMKVRLLA